VNRYQLGRHRAHGANHVSDEFALGRVQWHQSCAHVSALEASPRRLSDEVPSMHLASSLAAPGAPPVAVVRGRVPEASLGLRRATIALVALAGLRRVFAFRRRSAVNDRPRSSNSSKRPRELRRAKNRAFRAFNTACACQSHVSEPSACGL
jgi:hypothetical protein